MCQEGRAIHVASRGSSVKIGGESDLISPIRDGESQVWYVIGPRVLLKSYTTHKGHKIQVCLADLV